MGNLPHRDWLDELLAQPEPEIEDSGFSSRVLKAIPKRRSPFRMRLWILLICTLVACVISFWILPSGEYLWTSVSEVFVFESWIGIGVPVTSLLVVVMIVFGACAFAVYES